MGQAPLETDYLTQSHDPKPPFAGHLRVKTSSQGRTETEQTVKNYKSHRIDNLGVMIFLVTCSG